MAGDVLLVNLLSIMFPMLTGVSVVSLTIPKDLCVMSYIMIHAYQSIDFMIDSCF